MITIDVIVVMNKCSRIIRHILPIFIICSEVLDDIFFYKNKLGFFLFFEQIDFHIFYTPYEQDEMLVTHQS